MRHFRDSTRWRRFQFLYQPGACEGPVTLERRDRNSQHFRGFIFRQPGEESQLYKAGAARFELLQLVKRAVQFDQVRLAIAHPSLDILERKLDLVTASPLCVEGASVIHQQASKLLGSDREKMRTILPLHCFTGDQSQIEFVHQRGRLQGVTGSLLTHVMRGEPAEIRINARYDLVQRCPVPRAPVR